MSEVDVERARPDRERGCFVADVRFADQDVGTVRDHVSPRKERDLVGDRQHDERLRIPKPSSHSDREVCGEPKRGVNRLCSLQAR